MHVSGGTGVAPDNLASGVPLLSRATHLCGTSGTTSLTDGTIEWAVIQRRHLCLVSGSNLRWVFSAVNGYEAVAGAITTSVVPGTITISSTVWTGCGAASPNTAGTAHDILFGGATSYGITDGQVLESDGDGLTYTAGLYYWERTLVTVPAGSGGKWPLGLSSSAGILEGVVTGTGTPGTDYLHTGTIANSASSNGLHAVTTLGTAA